MQELFNAFLSESVSIRDTAVRKDKKENFYHGMFLGLLRAEGSWVVKSNAESGNGYSDILLTAFWATIYEPFIHGYRMEQIEAHCRRVCRLFNWFSALDFTDEVI